MQEVISTNGQHFETLTMGVEEGFNARLNQFNARTELEESGLLKQGGRAWLGGKKGFRDVVVACVLIKPNVYHFYM
jgi:hypothetical protein